MSEITRINELLKVGFDGPGWHGPSVREALEGVDARRAAARPIPNAHSIWEIVLHIAAWDGVIARRLRGEALREPDEGDFPAVTDTSEEAWAAALARLERNNADLRRAAAEIGDAELHEPPPNNTTPRFEGLHGFLHHQIYHAGQIALLKKAEPAA
jgi:uncharacterized damage-inducible protein DinB